MPSPWVLLDAPLSTSAASAGTYDLARALRGTNLAQRLQAGDAGALGPGPAPDALARKVGDLVDAGERPLVLGGDCSVALASAVLMERGRFALAYIDAHSDFCHAGNLEPQPATARTELAELTGRGDDRATFRDEDVALIGIRRDDPAFHELRRTKLLLWPMFWLYEHSREELDQSLLRRFAREEIDGIWVHVDADALDPSLVGAVPYPLSDGLAGPELGAILRTLNATGKVTAMSIANLDSSRDPDGRQASLLADIIVDSLGLPAGGIAP
jgi:arginase